MNLLPLLGLLIGLHAGCTFAELWIFNVENADAENYGVNAFLPTGGSDSTHPYNRAINFLRPLDENGNIIGLQGPPNEGLFSFMEWAFKTPVCGASGLTSLVLGYSTFSYSVIDLIPSDGWAGWIKLAIYLIGTFVTLATLGQVFSFVMRSGVMQSPAMLLLLGVVGGILAIGTVLTSGGLVDCSLISY